MFSMGRAKVPAPIFISCVLPVTDTQVSSRSEKCPYALGVDWIVIVGLESELSKYFSPYVVIFDLLQIANRTGGNQSRSLVPYEISSFWLSINKEANRSFERSAPNLRVILCALPPTNSTTYINRASTEITRCERHTKLSSPAVRHYKILACLNIHLQGDPFKILPWVAVLRTP